MSYILKSQTAALRTLPSGDRATSGAGLPRARVSRFAPRRMPTGGYLAGPLLLLAIWQIASVSGILSPQLLAAPSAALSTGYALWQDGILFNHLLASAARAYSGLLIGVTLGVVLALLSG